MLLEEPGSYLKPFVDLRTATRLMPPYGGFSGLRLGCKHHCSQLYFLPEVEVMECLVQAGGG